MAVDGDLLSAGDASLRYFLVFVGQLELQRYIVELFFFLLRDRAMGQRLVAVEMLGRSYVLGFELILEDQLALVETTELVNLVLILATDFDLVTGCGLVVFRKL